MELVAGFIVFVFGVFLFAMSLFIFARPVSAENFFNKFASSLQTHLAEQLTRLIIGASLLAIAPSMRCPTVFTVLGWIIVMTSIALLITPWRLHQRFARWVMPIVYQYFKLFALVALALSLFVFYGWSGIVLA